MTISKNVRLTDEKGTMFADKLLFDISKKTLNIFSSVSKVKANIDLK